MGVYVACCRYKVVCCDNLQESERVIVTAFDTEMVGHQRSLARYSQLDVEMCFLGGTLHGLCDY